MHLIIARCVAEMTLRVKELTLCVNRSFPCLLKQTAPRTDSLWLSTRESSQNLRRPHKKTCHNQQRSTNALHRLYARCATYKHKRPCNRKGNNNCREKSLC